MRRKAKSKPRSKPNPKPPIPPTSDKEESLSPPPQYKHLFHRYKANPKSTKNPDGNNENSPTPASESPLLHGISMAKALFKSLSLISLQKNMSVMLTLHKTAKVIPTCQESLCPFPLTSLNCNCKHTTQASMSLPPESKLG